MQRIGQEHAGKIKEKNEITALLASKMKIDHSKPPHSPMFSYKWTVALLGFLSVQRMRFGCWDECCYISFEWYVDSKKNKIALSLSSSSFYKQSELCVWISSLNRKHAHSFSNTDLL